MRRFVFASHHRLAYGMKDTVDFLTNKGKMIYDINAYLENEEDDLQEVIKKLFAVFSEEDEVIILIDLMGGSVYQQFYPYLNKKVHMICGMNLPLAMQFILAAEEPLTKKNIVHIIEECRKQIVYVNGLPLEVDEDDE